MQAAQLTQVRLIPKVHCRALPAPRGKPESSLHPDIYSLPVTEPGSLTLNPFLLLPAAWFPHVSFRIRGVQVSGPRCAHPGCVTAGCLQRLHPRLSSSTPGPFLRLRPGAGGDHVEGKAALEH